MIPVPIEDIEAVDEQLLLKPTKFFESTAPEVIQFALEAAGDARNDVEKGVRLFYAVRDGIRYDPYRMPTDEEGYQATTVLREKAGFCIPKSNLLAAAARALDIPSAVGFADVRNHLNTEKLRRAMGSDIFVYHGFTLLKLAGKWLKATAAFNLSLCERFGVLPLEFDGVSDALLHPFDASNRRHMEYIRERGTFADFPFQEVLTAFKEHYPRVFQEDFGLDGRFEEEKPLET